MAQFEIKDGVAIIPDGTTEIRELAFWNCTSLESISIPESVTEIGESAFEGCTSLESITIPESVTEIGGNTFIGCASLTSMTLPESVAWIFKSTFFYDRNGTYLALAAINVPAGKADFYKQRLPEQLHDKIVELAPEKKAKK